MVLKCMENIVIALHKWCCNDVKNVQVITLCVHGCFCPCEVCECPCLAVLGVEKSTFQQSSRLDRLACWGECCFC